MDPVTAIQLASAVLSFVQAGATVLKTAREIRDSADGLSDDSRNRQVVAESMRGAIRKLRAADQGKIACDPSLSKVIAECEDLSGKIENCLQRIQKSRFGRFGSASKALFKKDELEGLERKLDRCRSQLKLALGNLRDERLEGYSQELVSLLQNDRSKFEQLDADVKQLINGVSLGHIGSEANAQLENLLGVHHDALCAVYQHRILESLRFEGMGGRYEDVPDRHYKTFEWVFEEEDDKSGTDEDSQSPDATDEGDQLSDSTDEDGQLSGGTDEDGQSPNGIDEDSQSSDGSDEDCQLWNETDWAKSLRMKREARQKFLTWLSSPTGIFHVSGKLGSGKSTLMKSLYTSRRTRAEVEKWAGTRKLVFANFFFWKPGLEKQKSLDGLFRSLLYDILKTCPELTREVLPEYWAEAEKTPWQIQAKFDIPPHAVEKALEKIILDNRMTEDRCFCFFLDGLDEYDDSPRHQHDQTFLVDLLHRWSKHLGGNMMLCVSSREDNIFMNAFQESQRIRLHDLTFFDMRNYTRHTLEHFPNKAVRDRLIETIPEKAEGIFLWAVLVVKNIREIMPEGDVPDDELDGILDEIPSDLEELLRRILQGLGKRNRRKTYQTLALLQAARGNDLYLSLLAFSFLDRYQMDPGFALRDDFPTHETDVDLREDAPERYQKRLRRVCGGLVEHQPPSYSEEPWGRVEYTHRSVPELFEKGELKKDMESTLGEFNNIIALAHLVLAEVRFFGGAESKTAGLCAEVTTMLLREKGEEEPYTTIEFIDSHVNGSRHQDPGPSDRVNLQVHRGGWLDFALPGPRSETRPIIYFSTLCLAVYDRFDEYTRWKVENDTKALDSPFKRAIAAWVFLSQQHVDAWSRTWGYYFDTEIFTDETRTILNDLLRWDVVDTGTPANLTIWDRSQMSRFMVWCGAPAGQYDANPVCKIVERFLQHGAATDLRIVVSGEVEVEAVTFRFEHVEVTLKPPSGFHWDISPRDILTKLRGIGRFDEEHVHLSLRDWIEAAGPENKDRVLELLDSREEAERRGVGNATHGQPRPEHGEGEPESREEDSDEKEGTAETELVPAPTTGPFGDVDLRHKVVLGLVVFSVLYSAWVRLGARKGG